MDNGKDTRQIVRSEHGTLASSIWYCDEIKIGHAVSTFTDYVTIASNSKTDVVRMHFGLKGNYSFFYKQLHKSFDLIGGHHNIMYSPEFDMEVMNKTLEIETFGIQFPKELFIQYTQDASDSLQRFSERILKGENSILSESWGAINPSIQQVIQQIVSAKYTGEIKNIFLLSKSIELITLCADSYKVSATSQDLFLKRNSDKEKIIAVRDLINERVHNPPNLSEIAKAVGLNEYKLKRGFKEMFRTTVFGYLTEQRLNLAHQYLLDTEKTVAEIGYELGYSTPQHFNNAFKNKFRTTPYSIKKK